MTDRYVSREQTPSTRRSEIVAEENRGGEPW